MQIGPSVAWRGFPLALSAARAKPDLLSVAVVGRRRCRWGQMVAEWRAVVVVVVVVVQERLGKRQEGAEVVESGDTLS